MAAWARGAVVSAVEPCCSSDVRATSHSQVGGNQVQRRPRSQARGLVYRLRSARRSGRAEQGLKSLVRRVAEGSGVGESSPEVVIIGAGLAGLACATELHESGIPCRVLEANDQVGGRVRTDVVDGFLLDHGFQIFLTAYPQAQAMLDYDALDLKPFYAGASVRMGDTFHKVADPLRHPLDGVASLANPIGSVIDKVNIGLYRFRMAVKPLEDILQSPEEPTIDRLKRLGFSDSIVSTFFRPFFSGIFFDPKLGTSSRLLEFVFKMLALGSNCLPSRGIQALPLQLRDRLPSDAVRLGTKVARITHADGSVQVEIEGEEAAVPARAVVVATEGPEAAKLLAEVGEMEGRAASKEGPPVGTACLYFSLKAPPSPEPILYLNGNPSGIVNNCCFPSTVSASYAPPGKALASVSLVGAFESSSEQELVETVKTELSSWFGRQVGDWQFLKMYRIPFAQPNQGVPTDLARPVKLDEGVYVCGDHRETATFDGALTSGVRAARALVKDVKGT